MGILAGSVTLYWKLVSREIGHQGFGGSWQVKAVRGARRAPQGSVPEEHSVGAMRAQYGCYESTV